MYFWLARPSWPKHLFSFLVVQVLDSPRLETSNIYPLGESTRCRGQTDLGGGARTSPGPPIAFVFGDTDGEPQKNLGRKWEWVREGGGPPSPSERFIYRLVGFCVAKITEAPLTWLWPWSWPWSMAMAIIAVTTRGQD